MRFMPRKRNITIKFLPIFAAVEKTQAETQEDEIVRLWKKMFQLLVSQVASVNGWQMSALDSSFDLNVCTKVKFCLSYL